MDFTSKMAQDCMTYPIGEDLPAIAWIYVLSGVVRCFIGQSSVQNRGHWSERWLVGLANDFLERWGKKHQWFMYPVWGWSTIIYNPRIVIISSTGVLLTETVKTTTFSGRIQVPEITPGSLWGVTLEDGKDGNSASGNDSLSTLNPSWICIKGGINNWKKTSVNI